MQILIILSVVCEHVEINYALDLISVPGVIVELSILGLSPELQNVSADSKAEELWPIYKVKSQ